MTDEQYVNLNKRVHIAGSYIVAYGRTIQKCQMCGVVLYDSKHPSNIQQQFRTGDIIEQNSLDMTLTVLDFSNGVPEISCLDTVPHFSGYKLVS
jgi:hypothetical protein